MIFEEIRGFSRISGKYTKRKKGDFMKQIGNGFKEYYYLTEEG